MTRNKKFNLPLQYTKAEI